MPFYIKYLEEVEQPVAPEESKYKAPDGDDPFDFFKGNVAKEKSKEDNRLATCT